MQGRINNITALENAVQELIQTLPDDQNISLYTNNDEFRNTTIKALREPLLSLEYTANQLDLDEIILKGKNLFSPKENAVKNLLLLSDFQNRSLIDSINSDDNFELHLIRSAPEAITNISIDSVYVKEVSLSNKELWVSLSSNVPVASVPVSVFNKEQLIAKSTAQFDDDKKALVPFTISASETVEGTVKISDAGLYYDNQLFFNLNSKEKIKVQSIGDPTSTYLSRIFSDDTFVYSNTSLNAINYSLLENQNLLILNEIEFIPNSLKEAVFTFVQKGGHLIIIPSLSVNIDNYNTLLNTTLGSRILGMTNQERKITSINRNHPLFANVFTKNITNFQFPSVRGFYELKTNLPSILSFQGGAPFLTGNNGVYFFSAPLDAPNSNFTNSPLIVPTFYNIGSNSLKFPPLYFEIGQSNEVDVPVALGQDNVLKVLNPDIEFIPSQIQFPSKTTLKFVDNPKKDGIYSVTYDNRSIQNLAFNYNRDESLLNYTDVTTAKASINTSFTESFKNIEKELSITELWKWFIIFVVVFMLCEVLIQKFIK